MRRGLTGVAVGGLLALSAAACTGGGATGHSAGNTASPAGFIGKPQAASLSLPAGRSTVQYGITAPDPARYAFDVAVTAPVSANVGVSIRTWYGAILPSILDSSHDAGSCQAHGSQDVCFEMFPFLPAQRAGRWTVIAAKRSGPAATIRIVITFVKP
ncbi:MAG: hypothetical protein ACRDOU_22765 [Streptosporangiaceae bacterium]